MSELNSIKVIDVVKIIIWTADETSVHNLVDVK